MKTQQQRWDDGKWKDQSQPHTKGFRQIFSYSCCSGDIYKDKEKLPIARAPWQYLSSGNERLLCANTEETRAKWTGWGCQARPGRWGCFLLPSFPVFCPPLRFDFTETPSWRTNEAGIRKHYTSGIQGKDLGLDIQILVPNSLSLPRPVH